MAQYRLFLLSDEPAILSFDEFEADGDQEAIAKVEARFRTQPMELWEGHRKVLRFDDLDGPIPYVLEARGHAH